MESATILTPPSTGFCFPSELNIPEQAFKCPSTEKVGIKIRKSSEKVGIINVKSRDSRAFSNIKLITRSCLK